MARIIPDWSAIAADINYYGNNIDFINCRSMNELKTILSQAKLNPKIFSTIFVNLPDDIDFIRKCKLLSYTTINFKSVEDVIDSLRTLALILNIKMLDNMGDYLSNAINAKESDLLAEKIVDLKNELKEKIESSKNYLDNKLNIIKSDLVAKIDDSIENTKQLINTIPEQKQVFNKATDCSYMITGKNMVPGRPYFCHDCCKSGECICEACKNRCHANHRVTQLNLTKWFCDCGCGSLPCQCQCMTKANKLDRSPESMRNALRSILEGYH